MGFPSNSSVEVRASALQVDPLIVYAFAADHGRLPNDSSEISTFTNNVTGWASAAGADPDHVYGYLQATGGLPVNTTQLGAWLTDNGFFDTNSNSWTNKRVSPGEGYPPGGWPTPVTVPSDPTLPPPRPSTVGGFGSIFDDLSNTIRKNLIPVAIVAYLIFFKPKGRLF